jgi:hypothetical protein
MRAQAAHTSPTLYRGSLGASGGRLGPGQPGAVSASSAVAEERGGADFAHGVSRVAGLSAGNAHALGASEVAGDALPPGLGHEARTRGLVRAPGVAGGAAQGWEWAGGSHEEEAGHNKKERNKGQQYSA